LLIWLLFYYRKNQVTPQGKSFMWTEVMCIWTELWRIVDGLTQVQVTEEAKPSDEMNKTLPILNLYICRDQLVQP
jgi:hypothetical protein